MENLPIGLLLLTSMQMWGTAQVGRLGERQ